MYPGNPLEIGYAGFVGILFDIRQYCSLAAVSMKDDGQLAQKQTTFVYETKSQRAT